MSRLDGMQRQTELYGAPLGDSVRRITTALNISQARLARVLGVSPAMLSQLVSGQRATLADPTALTRLRALDTSCRGLQDPMPQEWRDRILREVAALRWRLPNTSAG